MFALPALPLPCLLLGLPGLAVKAISLTDQMSATNLFYFCYLYMVQPPTAVIACRMRYLQLYYNDVV